MSLLRRGDHSAARLQLDREKLDVQRSSSQSQKEKEFRQWLKRPEVREEFEEFFPGKESGGLTDAQIREIEKELNLL